MAIERKSRLATLWAILLAACLLNILPFVWIVSGSFKPHGEVQQGRVWPWQEIHSVDGKPTGEHVTADNYRKALGRLSNLPVYYANTIYLAVAGTFLALLIGSLAAYGFAQFKFFGNTFLFTLLLLTIMVPGEVCLIGQYELMRKLHLYDHVTGLLVAYTAGNLLLVIFIMRNVFMAVPQDVVHSAMLDGASSWRVFWDVMMPMGRNGLAACGILTFLGIWNEFIFALTFTTMEKVRTLPVGIITLRDQSNRFDSGLLFASVLMSFLPIVIVFLLLQKYFVRGLSAGALKG